MLCGCTKLAVGCTVLLLGTGCADRETAAWENLQKDASAEAYRSFLNEFPNGTHASAAQEGIAWIDAKSLNSMTAYDEFLAKYPKSQFLDEAQRGIRTMWMPELAAVAARVQRQDFMGARDRYVLMQRHGPLDPTVLNNLGVVLTQLGSFDEARAMLQRARGGGGEARVHDQALMLTVDIKSRIAGMFMIQPADADPLETASQHRAFHEAEQAGIGFFAVPGDTMPMHLLISETGARLDAQRERASFWIDRNIRELQ